MAFTQFGGKAFWDVAGIETTLGMVTKNSHDGAVINAIQVDPFVRTTNQRKQITDYYRRIAPALDGIRNQIAKLEKRKNEIRAKSHYSLTTVSVQPRTTPDTTERQLVGRFWRHR